jgi:selenium metabolism protein YedF
MTKTIDAKGLSCPQPVILAMKALDHETEITVIVDNAEAVENVRRLGIKSGCMVTVEKKDEKTFCLHLAKTGQENRDRKKEESAATVTEFNHAASGPLIIIISSDRMGRGNDELGGVLIRSFMHTLLTLNPVPGVLIFYNTGVKLVIRDSEVLDDLRQLEASGVSLLVCGTCMNYFGLSNDLAVGSISNMYDIASAMAGAGRVVTP